MITEFTAALSSIKTASDLATLVLKAKVDAAVRQKAIELQSDIISLQSALLSLQAQHQETLREKDRIKQQLVQMKNWKTEARKYNLKEIAAGVFVYAINEDKQGAQPAHWLCANCYENKQKSILQRGKQTYDGTIYTCGNCKVEILDHSKCRQHVSPAAGGRIIGNI